MDFDPRLLQDDSAERELARRGMIDFAQFVKPKYKVNWHHKVIADALDKFVSGEILRLMIFAPPQTGKSELTSRMLPPYIFGKNPDAKIILGSYSAMIAEGMSNSCQKYIDSEEYRKLFPNTTLQKVGVNGSWKRNAQEFQIVDHEGYLWAVGAGGSATSKTADFFIIDDPHKDGEEARSAPKSNTAWNWYTEVVDTRIHNKSGIMIMQTRWDVEDLSGRLLKAMEDGLEEKWTIICFKAIKENEYIPYDPRKTGEVLWPEMHSLARMLAKQKRDKRAFEHMYQQNPQPVMSGGECYKDFDRNETVKPCKYNKELTTGITFDFNKQPYMPAGVWQTQAMEVNGRKKWVARKIKELCLPSPKNTTRHVCIEFRKLYEDLAAKLHIYGDPHGFDEDTRSEQGHNDFRVIQKELMRFRPGMRVLPKAPNVGKRIDFMNALFSGAIEDVQIEIDPSCTHTIDDYQYIKEDEEGGKFKQMWTDPSTGVRSQRYGHCFVGETLIETIDGQKRIDEIKIGDFALTRSGYKKVLNTHNNGVQEIETYKIGEHTLTCTKDHRIWTKKYGFISVGHLSMSNIFCTFNRKEGICERKLLITADLHSQDTLMPKRGVTGCTIRGGLRLMGNGKKKGCTDISGFQKKEKSKRDTTSIMRMKTRLIMKYQTLDAYPLKNTLATIGNHLRKSIEKVKSAFSFLKRKKKLRSGITLKKEKNGIADRRKEICNDLPSKSNVLNAATNLQERGIQSQENSAPVRVKADATQEYSKQSTVYDITVDGEHEYFANGLLVHNCSDHDEYYLCVIFANQYARFLKGDIEPKILIGKRKDSFDGRNTGLY